MSRRHLRWTLQTSSRSRHATKFALTYTRSTLSNGVYFKLRSPHRFVVRVAGIAPHLPWESIYCTNIGRLETKLHANFGKQILAVSHDTGPRAEHDDDHASDAHRRHWKWCLIMAEFAPMQYRQLLPPSTSLSGHPSVHEHVFPALKTMIPRRTKCKSSTCICWEQPRQIHGSMCSPASRDPSRVSTVGQRSPPRHARYPPNFPRVK
jgi:hypothetical protein